MTLIERLKTMDNMVLMGKFIEAGEQFFHPTEMAHSSENNLQNGKIVKIEALKNFLNGIQHINHIALHYQAAGDNVTMSEFTFRFTSTYGSPIVWHEVIRRRWKDGFVCEEKYFTAAPSEQWNAEPIAQTKLAEDGTGMIRVQATYVSPVPPPPFYLLSPEQVQYTRIKRAASIPAFAPEAELPQESKVNEVEIPEPVLTDRIATESQRNIQETEMVSPIAIVEPMAEALPQVLEITKTIVVPAAEESIQLEISQSITQSPPVQPDDLKKIEGIGPKIEQILNDAGIKTFKQLAEANADIIKTFLLNAGPRFRMHDPTTWMQQATLAANNEWEKLEILQKDLKGGRVSK